MLCPKENFGETQQPAFLLMPAKDYANICPIPESSPELSSLEVSEQQNFLQMDMALWILSEIRVPES